MNVSANYTAEACYPAGLEPVDLIAKDVRNGYILSFLVCELHVAAQTVNIINSHVDHACTKHPSQLRQHGVALRKDGVTAGIESHSVFLTGMQRSM